MMFAREAAADFARYYGFHYDNLDERALVREFCLDMRRGLEGKDASMMMLPSYLTPASRCPPGKTVIALDAGGTNLRVSRVTFDEDGRAVPQGTKKVPMPGTRGRLSAPEFFDQVAAVTAPFFEEAAAEHIDISGMGFCFSYPMTMLPDGDGIPVVFSKELEIPEVIGKPIGAGIRAALAKRGITAPQRISLLNDTVSTLLTGVSSIPPRLPSKQRDDGKCGADTFGVDGGPVVGLILGTGLNTAYPEKRIPKINFEAKNESDAQIIVMESGGFFNRYQGKLDREFDATTKNPGQFTTEKVISGAYIGPLTLHIVKRAIADGVLSFARQDEITAMSTLASMDVNTFLHNPLAGDGILSGLFAKEELDALRTLYFLTEIVNERAAFFSAMLVAGVVTHMDAGRDPLRPVRIAVEGTTYCIYGQIRRSLESRLHTMLTRDAPRFYIVQTVEQASLIGAACAAAMNEAATAGATA